MRLTVESGSFAYKNGRSVINALDFNASSGELVAVLGANGSGKTTLLRCITGFLKWSAGRSLLDGVDIASVPDRILFSRIAYVPQLRGAVGSLTVREAVLLGKTGKIGVFSQPDEADIAGAEDVLARLGISHLADRKCSEISGGELQMVLIARALAAGPGVLILDEPESNLDLRNQLIVMDTVSGLAADGMCCIFTTHNPSHALTRAGKSLLLLPDGGYLFGETSAVLTTESIERVFGVKAVVGEHETPDGTVRSVVPFKAC